MNDGKFRDDDTPPALNNLWRARGSIKVGIEHIKENKMGSVLVLIADTAEIEEEMSMLEKVELSFHIPDNRITEIKIQNTFLTPKDNSDSSRDAIISKIYEQTYGSFKNNTRLERSNTALDRLIPKSIANFIDSLGTKIGEKDAKLTTVSFPKVKDLSDPMIVIESVFEILSRYREEFKQSDPTINILLTRLAPQLIIYAQEQRESYLCQEFLEFLADFQIVLPKAKDMINGKANL